MNTSKQFVNQFRMIAGALLAGLLVTSPVSAAQVPQPQAAATVTPKAAAGPVVENPRVALNGMVKAFTRVKTYNATQVVTSTSQGYETVTQSVIEYVAPSTMHMVDTVNGKPDEHIIVGNTLYVSTTLGWQKSQMMVATLLKNMSFAGVTRIVKSAPSYVTKATYIGPDTVNGVATQVYEYQMRLSILPIKATTTIWIGADHLPYRMDTSMTAKYNGKTITNTGTALVSGYNTPITITLPISVTR